MSPIARRRLHRPFHVLLLATFVAIIGGAAALTARYAVLSFQASRLSRSLADTLLLNQALRQQVHEQVRLLHLYARDPDPVYVDRFRALNFAIGRDQTRYLQLEIGDDERVMVDRVKRLHNELASSSLSFFELARGGLDAAATLRLERVQEMESQLSRLLEQLGGIQVAKLEANAARTRQTTAGHTLHLVGSGVALLALVLAFTWLVRRRVLAPIGALLAAARRLRGGELESRAPVYRDDELGELAEEFNYMASELAESQRALEAKVEERTREIRALQQQLVQSEKMSAVGQLVSGVAHELNNPLTAIIGYAELATRREASVRADDGQAFQEILFQAERCRRIVANLLQFARQRETQLLPTRLNAEVERSLELRQYELATRNVRLVRDLAAEDPVVLGDPYKLQQVILVLLNNAIDAIDEAGGEGTVWVATRCEGADVVLEVRDTGTGIRSADRIFDPFYTTKPAGKGTGLGLSICYGIVQEHGGEVRAENWEHGARFLVRFQRTLEAPAAAPDAPEGEERAPASGRILVVDDEEVLLKLQSRMLERMGLEVECARSAQAAKDLLARSKFDLVVCDMRMPDASGLDLFVWVTERQPALRERFLLASGDLVNLAAGEQQLPVPCLRKPFSYKEYSGAVEQLLGKGARVP
jgi:signal transduction histidine kinase/CheY-like chemotaxis protein